MQVAMIGLGRMGGSMVERLLGERGIEFLDAGTSGGIRGLENGHSLTVGGSERAVSRCEPPFRTLAPLRRVRSRQEDGFSATGIALRNEFGGRPVQPE